MRILKMSLMVLLTLSLVYCEKKDTETAPKTDKKIAKTTDSKPDTGAVAVAEKLSVKLEEAGAEPRSKLRYKFQAGRKDKLVMDMKMSMAMSMGSIKQPETVLPVARTTMDIDSQSVSPEGNLKYTFKVSSAEVVDEKGASPLVVQTMQTELKKTVGMSGWAIVTPRGFTEDAEINVPDGASQQLQQMIDNLRQQLKQLSSPLPEEPVGIGAKWKVTMPLNTDALKLVQTADYELTELKGNNGKLAIKVSQFAKKQSMKLPNLPPGTSAMLNSLKTKASGSATFDLTLPVPKSNLSLATSMAMTIKAQGQTQDVTTDMKIDIEIHP
jgi:hypothetical protein